MSPWRLRLQNIASRVTFLLLAGQWCRHPNMSDWWPCRNWYGADETRFCPDCVRVEVRRTEVSA